VLPRARRLIWQIKQ